MKRISRQEFNEQSEQRPTVGIVLLVIRGNTLLVGKRFEEHGRGKLSVPGGHLEYGESIETCAVRELLEETGMVTTQENVRVVTLTNQPLEGAHYVNIGVLIHDPEGNPQETAPDEHQEWQWIDIHRIKEYDLYDMVLPTINKYIEGKYY